MTYRIMSLNLGTLRVQHEQSWQRPMGLFKLLDADRQGLEGRLRAFTDRGQIKQGL